MGERQPKTLDPRPQERAHPVTTPPDASRSTLREPWPPQSQPASRSSHGASAARLPGRLGRFRHVGAPLAVGAARLLQLAGSMAVVPVLLRALGREEFALWMAITSLFIATTFIDLGLGGALVNRLSNPQNPRSEKRRAVSSSVFGLALFWTCVAIALAIVFPSLNWDRLFGIAPGTRTDVGPAVALMLVYLCIMAPLGLIARIHLGLDRSHVQSLWDATASILVLIGMLMSVRLGGRLTMVVLVAASVPLITTAMNWLQLLRTQPWLTPRWREASWQEFVSLIRHGGIFFLIAVCGAVAFGSDSLIAASVLGAKAAAEPMVALRLAAALQTLMAGMVLPYWPRLSGLAAGSVADRNRALRQTFAFITLVSATAAAGALLFGPAAIRIWTGGTVGFPSALAVPIAAWLFVFGLAQGLLTAFSVDHLVRTQLMIAAASGVLILVCKVVGAVLFGAPGLVIGGVAALLCGSVIPLTLLLLRDLRRAASAPQRAR